MIDARRTSVVSLKRRSAEEKLHVHHSKAASVSDAVDAKVFGIFMQPPVVILKSDAQVRSQHENIDCTDWTKKL